MTERKEEYHQCHFCGDYVKDGVGADGKRHWLSDCRPDLVEHEVGPTCTWYYDKDNRKLEDTCYAYQEFATQEWGKEHIHFHKDGPM